MDLVLEGPIREGYKIPCRLVCVDFPQFEFRRVLLFDPLRQIVKIPNSFSAWPSKGNVFFCAAIEPIIILYNYCFIITVRIKLVSFERLISTS